MVARAYHQNSLRNVQNFVQNYKRLNFIIVFFLPFNVERDVKFDPMCSILIMRSAKATHYLILFTKDSLLETQAAKNDITNIQPISM